MKAMNFFSIWFIIIIYLLKKCSGIILSDNINSNINWIFLTKFYFHPIDGYININLNIKSEDFPSMDSGIKFFVLNKEEWMNDLAKICLKKELILNEEINQTNFWSLSTSFTSNNQMYFILSKCNSSLNIFNLSYKLILTNGENLFTKHFSNDERGILGLFIISTSIYTILFLIILRYIYLIKIKFCLIIKFYLVSILCSWLNSLISLIFTLIFSLTGNNQTFLYRLLLFLGRFFYFTAQILFLLTLILCAKGYLILRIQLKTKILFKIKLFMLLYILMQIILLIIITIFTNRVIINENILMICDCIQMIMYLLSCIWFILSVLFTTKNSDKKFYFLLSFSIWFLTNAIVVLLNILDILPNPQITILKTIQINIQCLSYFIFQFIIRSKKFFLQTKLNQINITYIDPTLSKSEIKQQSTIEKETNTKSTELTNLCFIENTWASRLRMPIKSLEPLPRLEPRRDIFSQSSIISTQPSFCSVPRRLSPLKHDNQ